jgi:hypothetical protein
MINRFLLAKIKIMIHCFLKNHKCREVTRYYGEHPRASTYSICIDCGYKG